MTSITHFLLDRIISFKETTPFILLIESIHQSSFPIFTKFLKNDSKSRLLICLETHPQLYSSLSNSSLTILDFYGNKALPSLIYKEIEKKLIGIKSNSIIFIDGLNRLLISNPIETITLIKKLVKLLSKTESCLIISHAIDLYQSESSLNIDFDTFLQSEASTIIVVENLLSEIKIQKSKRKSAIIDENISKKFLSYESNHIDSILCYLTHRKRSGKVAHETSVFILSNGIVSINSIPGLTAESSTQNINQNNFDPIANLPFNLSLTDEQRSAKNNVNLPYLDSQKELGGGNIYYEPDSGDDYDDEDPDEDLDI